MVNEFRTVLGGGLLGISKKIIFIFKTRQKMVTKFGRFKKLKCREGSRLCKLSKLCYHFLSSVENENNFFDIPSNPPPIAVRNALTNQFYQQKLCFCIFSTTKKVTSFSGTLLYISVLHLFVFENIQKH